MDFKGLASVDKLREELRAIVNEPGQSMKNAAREMRIAYNTVQSFLKEKRFPFLKSLKRMEAWVELRKIK